MTVDRVNLTLGSAQWGMAYGVANRTGQTPPDDVARILATARSSGITTIDTARAYGTSEEVIGRLVASDPSWEVFTKLAPELGDTSDEATLAIARAEQSMRASRAALGRQALAGLLLHDARHRHAWREAVWRWLVDLRDQGEIQQLGISAASLGEAEAAVEDDEVDVLQVATSILDQRLVRAGLFERARDRGKRLFARSAFLQGAVHLPVRELPPHLRPIAEPVELIRRWAEERHLPVAAPYLLFVRYLPGSPSAVVGTESVRQLRDAVDGWVATCDREELDELATSIPCLPDGVLDPWRWP